MSKRRASAPPRIDTPSGVGERILTTAHDLFYREGVRAVGIQRVIDEAGIAKASLYAHYESKDDLVAACMVKRAEVSRALIEERLGKPGLDARSKVLELFDLQVETVSGTEFRGCPFQNAGSEIVDPHHPAKAITAAHRQWWHALIAGLVKEAGVVSAAEVTGTLVVLYDGAAVASLVNGGAAAARHARWAAEQLIDAHLPARSRGARHRRSRRA